MDDLNIIRHMVQPPDEAYDIALREAIGYLQEAGPKAGFVLVIVKDDGTQYDTMCGMSSGSDQIAPHILREVVNGWLGDGE